MLKKFSSIFLSISFIFSFLNSCKSNNSAEDNTEQNKVSDSVAESVSEGTSNGDSILETNNGGLNNVGLYVWDDTPDQHKFWKKCGIDTLQFCDRGWFYNSKDGSLDTYIRGMQSGIRKAKQAGFKVNVILFSNIEQYKGKETESASTGIKFHPDDKKKLSERLDYIEKSVKAYALADGFTFFAGDPGGITNALGNGDVYDYINMALEVKKIVNRVHPKASFNINPWAVTMFETPNLSVFTPDYWLKETELHKIIINENNFVGTEIGIELACPDYYRPLTLRLYDKYGKNPEKKFPQSEDISKLITNKTERIWAWPYFLLDEADDGDKGNNPTNLPEIETRYIYRYLNDIRELGFNGVIGSWSFAGYKSKSLNTYAFGRMANDITVTPIMVIKEYASFIATKETAPVLADILCFIENNSNFVGKLPESEKAEKFKTNFKSSSEALKALKKVKADGNNKFPLPIERNKYLSEIEQRLKLIK